MNLMINQLIIFKVIFYYSWNTFFFLFCLFCFVWGWKLYLLYCFIVWVFSYFSSLFYVCNWKFLFQLKFEQNKWNVIIKLCFTDGWFNKRTGRSYKEEVFVNCLKTLFIWHNPDHRKWISQGKWLVNSTSVKCYSFCLSFSICIRSRL